jgi:hypothetical protein
LEGLGHGDVSGYCGRQLTLCFPEGMTAQKLEMHHDIVYDVIAQYENITYKDEYRLNPATKKHKFTIQLEDTNKNIVEVFYTSKDKYHVCTRINLSKYSEDAQYHEKWDMFWDLYVDNSLKLTKVLNFIFEEFDKAQEEA